VAAPCEPWHCLRGPVQIGSGGRPLNGIVRQHMTPLSAFERQVLDACLAGSSEQLSILRAQAAVASVLARKHTGPGAYIDLATPESLPLVTPRSLVIDDVDVRVAGVSSGLATILYVVAGRLNLLEFATHDDAWPADPVAESIGYFRFVPADAKSFALEPVAFRDTATLMRLLSDRGARDAA
jgi:hypothetical protein